MRPAGARAGQGRAQGPDGVDDSPFCVLVVEDEYLIRASVLDEMEDLGHRALEAESAEEALAVLEAAAGRGEAVHVLMTDLGLPGMGGGELAAAVRARYPAIGVVFATGADELPDVPGAPPVRLDKPFGDDQLLGALERASGRRL